MRPILMDPVTVRVARQLRLLDGERFVSGTSSLRILNVRDRDLVETTGMQIKRVREGLLNLERLGAITASDLLPGPAREPKQRQVQVIETHPGWIWLSAFDALENAYNIATETEVL